jgi:hypothetical protein
MPSTARSSTTCTNNYLRAELPPRASSTRWTTSGTARKVDLPEALEQYLTYGDAIISCLPGELGLYVGEDGHPVLLLVRSERRGA